MSPIPGAILTGYQSVPRASGDEPLNQAEEQAWWDVFPARAGMSPSVFS